MINTRHLTPIRLATLIIGGFSLLSLSGCGGIKTEAKYPTGYDRNLTDGEIYEKPKSVFGSSGLKFGRGNKDKDEASGIGVNTYLWRASLDTISFMPVASADPFGGVILTDWYNAAETPNERVKLNVFIMGRQLRSDGVRVRVFKQIMTNNVWQDVEAAPATARELEDSILTRARQLRIAQTGAPNY